MMPTLSMMQQEHIQTLTQRYPDLSSCTADIIQAFFLMAEAYRNGGKLLIAGNGGSAADAEHIAGELMKRFRIARPVAPDYAARLTSIDPIRGASLAKNLERGLVAIPLVAHEALTTAYMNDVDSLGVFAQQLYGYGNPGDIFLGISTSGNSENIVHASVVARASGIRTIALTGPNESLLSEAADVTVRAPGKETYLIQENHLPIYHCWCMMLEEEFFGTPSHA